MTELLVRLTVLVAIFASVFLLSQLVLSTVLNRRSERTAVNRRLTLLRSGLGREEVSSSLLKNLPPELPNDAGLLTRARIAFIRMVMMSALPVQARRLSVGMVVATGTVATLILLLAWGAGYTITVGAILLVVVTSVALSIGLPIMIISRIARRRRKKMEEQFPVALDIFTRSLRAGHPVASAIFLITEEMEDPIGSEFGLVSDEVSYGAELTDALADMAERWDLDDMRMFVVSISVQSETGGNLAEILQNLSSVIRARASMYMKVRALSSEGRMSAWMLTALPVLTLLSMLAVNPGFYFDVAQDRIFVIGFSSLIVLYAIGVVIIRKIVDLKV
ncbi:type II secretion system F family protein [Parafrankia sp. BMG5.11]|uniref:type II secretion system F family protein n=1 Tax=Parafrankia sp. BMG5.11 TaxID=222540 RepID=UPI001040368C|nr:type II secretion system F family protein [Parafrankia sp. BMG5.11]TCJ39493.1 secretion system protein [Parafrankia sp. BMG5.11]